MFRNCKPKLRNIWSITLSGRYEILTEAETEEQARENVTGAARRLRLDFVVTRVYLKRRGTWVHDLKSKAKAQNGSRI